MEWYRRRLRKAGDLEKATGIAIVTVYIYREASGGYDYECLSIELNYLLLNLFLSLASP